MSLLDKVARLISGEKNALTAAGSVAPTASWIEDNKVKGCYECGCEFSTYVRRHYCRVCARLFCAGCTRNSLPPPKDSPDQPRLRACNFCYRSRHQSPLKTRNQRGPPQNRNGDAFGLERSTSTRLPGSIKSVAGDLTWDIPPELEDDWGSASEGRRPGPHATAATAAAVTEPVSSAAANTADTAADGSAALELPNNVMQLYKQLLQEASNQHLSRLIMQLMVSEAITQPDVWLPVLLKLSLGAVSCLSPSGSTASDPRQYVKVKKLPGVGKPEDSCVVQGVVCKKNVAHKRMRSQVSNATVLLLAGSLEAQRTDSKLSSFETLLEQEQEQLREAVSRVATLRPDVLLLERSVARVGQELLRECGISLVLNVKPELLERVARCLGTKVLQSLDHLSHTAVGMCKDFRVETVALLVPLAPPPALSAANSVASVASSVPPAAPVPGAASATGSASQAPRPAQNTPLMFFDGCPKPLGVTVLLKGADVEQLVKIKRILRFLALAVYESYLENGLLGDELSCATSVTVNNLNAALKNGVVGGVEGGMQALQELGSSVVTSSAEATASRARNNILLTATPHINVLDFIADEVDDTPADSAPKASFGSTFEPPALVKAHHGSIAEPSVLVSRFGVVALAASSVRDGVEEKAASWGVVAATLPQQHDNDDLLICAANSGAGSSAGGAASVAGGASTGPGADAGGASAGGASAGGVDANETEGAAKPCDSGVTPGELKAAELAAETEALAAAAIAASQAKATMIEEEAAAAAGMLRAPSTMLGLEIMSSSGSTHVTVDEVALFSDPLRISSLLDSLSAAQPSELMAASDSVPHRDSSPVLAIGLPIPQLIQHPLQSSMDLHATALSQLPPIPATAFATPSTMLRDALTASFTQDGRDGGDGGGAVAVACSAGVSPAQATAQAAANAAAVAKTQLTAMKGLQVYDNQRMFMSMSCRNPRKQLLCEPHSVKRIDYYSSSDLSLKQFIIAASPHPNKRCGMAECGEGVTSHVRTFLHGNARITLSIATIPAGLALPGEDKQQIWLWMRPKGMGPDVHGSIRRVELSAEAASLSFGQFLQLSFTADELHVKDRSLHHDFVRYFGLGRTVMCLYQDRILPYHIDMPDLRTSYSMPAQLKWLKQESLELCQEADEAFDVVEASLRKNPLFHKSAESTEGSDAAATTEPASNRSSVGYEPEPSELSGSSVDSRRAAVTSALDVAPSMGSASFQNMSLQSVISSVRKDRTSFMEKVSEAVNVSALSSQGPDAARCQWGDEVLSGVMELNRLRRSLAITLLSWAASLQDPGAYAMAYARASGTAGFPYSAALDDNGAGSGGGNSSVGPELVMDPTDPSTSHMMPVPIVPNQSGGPIAVPIVAEMVALANTGSMNTEGQLLGSCYGEVLEGSQALRGLVVPTGQGSSSEQQQQQEQQDSQRQGQGQQQQPNQCGGQLAGPDPISQHPSQLSHNAFEEACSSSDDDELVHNSFLAGWGRSQRPQQPQEGVRDEEEDETFYPNQLNVGFEEEGASEVNRRHTCGTSAYTSHSSINFIASVGDRMASMRMQSPDGSAGPMGLGFDSLSLSPSVGRTLSTLPYGRSYSLDLGQGVIPHRQSSLAQPTQGPPLPRLGSNSSLGGGAGSRRAVEDHPLHPPAATQEALRATRSGGTGSGGAGSAGPSGGGSPLYTSAAAAPHQEHPTEALLSAGQEGDEPSAAASALASAPAETDAAEGAVKGPDTTVGADAIDNGPTSSGSSQLLQKSQTWAFGDAPSGAAVDAVGVSSLVDAVGMGGPLAKIRRDSASKQLSLTNRTVQNVRQKLEGISHVASTLGSSGLAGFARICLPGRALLPAGVNDCVVPIYDTEPTSIIAHALSTRTYQQMLNATIKAVFQDTKRATQQSGQGSWNAMGPSLSMLVPPTTPGGETLLQPGLASMTSSGVLDPGNVETLACGEVLTDSDWLGLMLSREPLHVRHQFEDEAPGMPWARAKFQVVAYYAPQFAELRRRCVAGGEAAYIASMCRCRQWNSSGGKSNAYFAKTKDDRYIIKSLSKVEKASFLEFAPAYFEHMAKSCVSQQRTCLSKLLGVYSVASKSLGGGGPMLAGSKDGILDLLIMENCFYDRQISRIYDLKGSSRNRFNAEAAANPQDAKEVHLDDNLRQANLTSPIFVDPVSLRDMELAVWADTAFLANLDIMDYSLLVGVDKDSGCLAVSIIDFIRQFTWDKQLETWVKSSGMLGGNGKEPTIVSPKQYMRRFRMAIPAYFTVVPTSAEMEPPLDPDMA